MKGLHIQIRKCPNVHNATSHTSLSQSRERNFVMLSLHKYSHMETYCNIHILHLHLPFHTGEKEPLLCCVYIQKPFTLWPGLALRMAGRTPLNLCLQSWPELHQTSDHSKCLICRLYFQMQVMCSGMWAMLNPTLEQSRVRPTSVLVWPNVKALSCIQPQVALESVASLNSIEHDCLWT